MSPTNSIKNQCKAATRAAWIASIIYLCLFPILVMLAITSILIFDDPSLSRGLGLVIIFAYWCVPLSIPISLYKVWSQHAAGNYKKCRQYCLAPLYVFIALFVFDTMINTIRHALELKCKV